jgi:hypothetical protein
MVKPAIASGKQMPRISLRGAKEDKASWSGFIKHLKERGLRSVRLIISDACTCRKRCRVLPRGWVATLRCPLVPQCLQPCALGGRQALYLWQATKYDAGAESYMSGGIVGIGRFFFR